MFAERNEKQTNQQAFESETGLHVQSRQRLYCANCDIEILWRPVVVQGKVYCCAGCAAGGPCTCDYSQYRSVNIAGVIHYEQENGGATTGAPDDREIPEQ
uniref:Uncharacterized protein n=1 Tax=Thermosporothrix sp. COM3 TaxID=2490863 RepID=A0A455SQD3_9CHLR|nr:hypothetical protein KTC_39900 [Thermosporothrix sp. COM3]